MRSWQRQFIGQGTLLLIRELGSRGELQSKVMEDGDTVTHALQGECKTYRGCQSSGVTDSDSERQHEINMAVQTVQGRGRTDCQEGGTDTCTCTDTHSHVALQNMAQACTAGQGCTHHTGLHIHNHTLIFADIQNPVVHRGASKAVYLFTHLLATAHSHSKSTLTSRLTFIPAEPAVHLGLSTYSWAQLLDMSLTEDSYLLTILNARVETNSSGKREITCSPEHNPKREEAGEDLDFEGHKS